MTHWVTIPGPPKGKDRPRFVRATGRAYTPKETKLAEARIAEAWLEQGAPRVFDGPVEVDVHAFHVRPASHLTSKGLLSTEGKRHLRPDYKSRDIPDGDNVLKLALDALNGKAWRDDGQVVRATIERWWAPSGDGPSTWISFAPGSTREFHDRAVSTQ